MSNLNIRTKIVAVVLAGGISLSLAGCGVDTSRKVIKDSNISVSNSDVKFYYDNGSAENPNIDYSNTNIKEFDVGEHILMLKVAGTIDYDKFVQMELKEGYEVTDFTYCENATGEYGYSYGYFAFMFKNTDPVKVVGYYDKTNQAYVYTGFGEVITKDKQLVKE